MTEFKNSPLQDPNFLNPTPAAENAAGVSQNKGFNALVAASDRADTNLANDNQMANDLLSMDYFQLEQRYGRDVADNREQLQSEINRQDRIDNASRTAGQFLGDSASSIIAGAVSAGGGIVASVLGGAGKVDQYFNPENTGFSELGAEVAEFTQDGAAAWQSLQSDEIQDRRSVDALEGQLQAQDSAAQAEMEIRNGASRLEAGFRQVGRDIVNSGERLLSDPALAGDTIANALGSLGPSAKLAQMGKEAAGRFGVAVGVGASEASGAYSETTNEILGMDHKDLQGNRAYDELIAEGLSPDRARAALASNVGLVAFGRQMPTAMALGFVAAKFEASPIKGFSGSGMVDGFRTIGVQALEESAQGGTGAYNQNAALQAVDENRSLTDGVGEQIATGAIAGAGMAGALASPSVAVNTAAQAIDVGREVLGNGGVRAIAAEAANAAANATDAVASAASTVAEKAAPLVEPTKAAVSAVAKPVAEAVAPIIKPIAEKAAQVAERGETKQSRAGQIITARQVEVSARRAVESTKETNPALTKVAVDLDTTAIPSGFTGSASNKQTLVQNVSGIAQKLAQKSVRVSALPDADVLYAASQINALKSEIPNLPKGVAAKVSALVSHSSVRQVERQARTVDLNNTVTADTQITPNNTAEAVTVAKVNPANVNPEFVGKILEQKNSGLSAEDVRMLKAAQEVAASVNNHVGRQVEISTEERIALSKKPAYQANPGKLPTALTQDDVSRSVSVSGFTDKSGKKLRSVNEFAADIFAGGQSGNGKFINSDGQSVAARPVAESMVKFVQHMTNKVDALNRSFQNNQNGKGPLVPYEGLVAGEKFIKPGEKGAPKPVAYHSNSPKSVKFAQQVAADAKVASEVAAVLAKTFPELFEGLEVPAVLELAENTTAVEEVSPQEETNEQPQTEEIQDEPNTDADDNGDNANLADDPDSSGTSVRNVGARFDTAYQPSDDTVVFGSFDEAVEGWGDSAPAYVSFARSMVDLLPSLMNKRLETKKLSKKDPRSIKQVILDGDTDVSAFRPYRNTAIVDQTTGEYDPQLLELATMAVVDWMSSVTSSDPSRADETLEALGMTEQDITDENVEDVLFGVPPKQAVEGIAANVLKLWNVRVNIDAPLTDTVGVVEGVVNELLTVVSDNTDFINIATLNTRDANGKATTTNTINVKGLQETQKGLGPLQKNKALELLTGEKTSEVFVNEVPAVSRTQNRSDIQLSKLETSALKKMQETPHFPDMGRIELVKSIGEEAVSEILGFKDVDEDSNKNLMFSVMGKNLSIEMDWLNAMSVADLAETEDTAFHYKVGITKVGRHQYQGINPQSNKILRALVAPTWSTLDMHNQDDADAFWLGVAQAADLFKVEKKPHAEILADVQGKFFAEFGDAVSLVRNWLSTGEIDGQAFAEAMGNVEMQQIAAVHAVAEMQYAMEQGRGGEFRTSLSFELDGLTNGAANMMVNYGQGEITKKDFFNFNRIGFFLGRTGTSLNNFFGAGNKDLYETTSATSEANMVKLARKMKPADQQRMAAANRFAAHFGNFKLEDDGSIHMTRNTAKNPMTKVNYGSGVKGVGVGIADDMIKEFYSKTAGIPNDVKLEEYLNYPGMLRDIEALFGVSLPNNLDEGRFSFHPGAVEAFQKSISDTLGEVLATSTKSVIGDKITELNDVLVYTSNVQAKYMELAFEKALTEEIADQRESGKIGKGEMISKRDYDALTKEIGKLAPTFTSDDQTLRIAGFSKQKSNFQLSASMDDKLRQNSNLPAPEEAGVKAIPFSVIGTGDAMMMNTVYGTDGAPADTLPIFDGIDVPLNKVKDYAQHVNKSVLSTWDRDVLSQAVDSFQSFLNLTGSDPLVSQAFAEVAELSKNSSVTAETPKALMAELNERHRQNQARKAVFKKIPMTVDQMGGSSNGYVRGEGTMTLAEINELIDLELNPVEVNQEADAQPVVIETYSADAMLKAIVAEGGDLAVALKAVKDKMPEGLQIVTGDVAGLNDYRQENFPDDGQFLTAAGNYDMANNTIFISEGGHETMAHEMIHAATFNAVLSHFEGNTDAAVGRMEGLMGEFMDLSLESQGSLDARTAILQHQVEDTPFNRAAAVNEFMAWGLTNQGVTRDLKTTVANRIKKAVVALAKRIMGKVPTSIYDNLLFNTKVLGATPPVNNDDGGTSGGPDHYTNQWIETLKDIVADIKEGTNSRKLNHRTVTTYIGDAKNSLRHLADGGIAVEEKTYLSIHTVMATEFALDVNSLAALNKTFAHVTENLKPEHFGKGREAQEKYSTVMEAFGGTENLNGSSDAVAVLMALSQSSPAFRAALEKVEHMPGTPAAEGVAERMNQTTVNLLRKVIGSVQAEGNNQEVLDNLSESLLKVDQEQEFRFLRGLMGGMDKADAYVSGAMSQLAETTEGAFVNAKDRSRLTKAIVGTVAQASALFDGGRAVEQAAGAKELMNQPFMDNIMPVREFVSEVIGTDRVNTGVVALLDRTNHAVSAVRQAFRENLPTFFKGEFSQDVSAEQMRSMHKVLGRTDFAKLYTGTGSLRLLSEKGLRSTRIREQEAAIQKNFDTNQAAEIIKKSHQLADFMNGEGAGHQLFRNAYAIVKLSGEFKESMVAEVDKLVSLYAIDGADTQMVEDVVALEQTDTAALKNMIAYMKTLDAAEDAKDVSEAVKLNGYKGYLPDQNGNDRRIIIGDANEIVQMEREGFTFLGSAPAADGSIYDKAYFVSNSQAGGRYSQGVMQNVHMSYRGVDIQEGRTASADTSGFIGGDIVETITDDLNKAGKVGNVKEVLMPIFNDDAEVVGYERAVNPDLLNSVLERKSDLAESIGQWAGRQAEEATAHEYNAELVNQLGEIWENREQGSDNQFVNFNDINQSDEIYRDIWAVIPKATKAHIEDVFGEGQFMVRKDMVNLSLGYREASIADVWTGKTRMPETVQDVVRGVSGFIMGSKALKILNRAEGLTQSAVSSAKELIVIRSVVVPYANMQANVFQLMTRGVGTKEMIRGYREKLGEVEQYNDNVTKIIELNARITVAGETSNKGQILRKQVEALEAQNHKMTIAPLVNAGAYKNISEGITPQDVAITSGKLGDWLENQVDKIPNVGVKTVVKYGIVSRDTAMYKTMNKAIQYGDFLAKSIYHDHLIAQGLDADVALAKVNEEFVNFSVLPGRTRSYLEGMGATWFMAFKIRIAKIAMQQMRENPVRALVSMNMVDDSPLTDNLAAKASEGTLDYSLGWEMLWGSPDMNPWMQAYDWANN